MNQRQIFILSWLRLVYIKTCEITILLYKIVNHLVLPCRKYMRSQIYVIIWMINQTNSF